METPPQSQHDSTVGWIRAWSSEGSLVRLAVFRIVVFVCVVFITTHARRSFLADDPDFEEPIWWSVVYGVLLLAGTAGIVGLATRWACFSTVVCSPLYPPLHYTLIPMTVAGLTVLSFLPAHAGARLSVDWVVHRMREAGRARKRLLPPSTGPRASWPLQFVQVLACVLYVVSGLGILLGWNDFDFRVVLWASCSPWLQDLAESRRFMSAFNLVMAAGLMCFPLGLFARRVLWITLPIGVLLLGLVMIVVRFGQSHPENDPTPLPLDIPVLGVLLTASFLPLERIPAILRERWTSGALALRVSWWIGSFAVALALLALLFSSALSPFLALLVLPLIFAAILALRPSSKGGLVFDGGCGICLRTASLLESLDWTGRVTLYDLTRWDEVQAAYPQLDQGECTLDMHFVDAKGGVYRGFRAYRALAWRLPLLVPVAPLLYLPGVEAVGDKVYRHVADNRTRCELPNSGAD